MIVRESIGKLSDQELAIENIKLVSGQIEML